MIPQSNRPFVGKSAFAHKGGIHVSAIMKVPSAYEHMDPEVIGNSRRVLVSDMSGKVLSGDQVIFMSNGGFANIHDKLLQGLELKYPQS